MKHEKPLSLETYLEHVEFTRIGNKAARAAQRENRELGIPNVYALNGRMYWQMPNGEITCEDPEAEESPHGEHS